MSTKCRIAIVELDSFVRWTANEWPPSDHLEIAEPDKNVSAASAASVARVISRTLSGVAWTQACLAMFRIHIGENAPLLCRAGRNVYLLFRQFVSAAQKRSSCRLTHVSFSRCSASRTWDSRCRAPRSRMTSV